jgi:hypothetical protein
MLHTARAAFFQCSAEHDWADTQSFVQDNAECYLCEQKPFHPPEVCLVRLRTISTGDVRCIIRDTPEKYAPTERDITRVLAAVWVMHQHFDEFKDDPPLGGPRCDICHRDSHDRIFCPDLSSPSTVAARAILVDALPESEDRARLGLVIKFWEQVLVRCITFGNVAIELSTSNLSLPRAFLDALQRELNIAVSAMRDFEHAADALKQHSCERIWDRATRSVLNVELLRTMQQVFEGHPRPILGLQLSPYANETRVSEYLSRIGRTGPTLALANAANRIVDLSGRIVVAEVVVQKDPTGPVGLHRRVRADPYAEAPVDVRELRRQFDRLAACLPPPGLVPSLYAPQIGRPDTDRAYGLQAGYDMLKTLVVVMSKTFGVNESTILRGLLVRDLTRPEAFKDAFKEFVADKNDGKSRPLVAAVCRRQLTATQKTCYAAAWTI